MQKLYLTSPFPKTVNHYTGIRIVYRSGKQIPIVYETAEAKVYKRNFIEYIKQQVIEQGWSKVDNKFNHLYMDGYFYMPQTHVDAANCDKILSDAITESGVVWEDDSGILFRPQHIYYDKEHPRIDLVIYPVDYIGIFKDQEECIEFEEQCMTCSRYSRNCSILRRAKEGRIQNDIHFLENELSWKCQKYKEKKRGK